jgi:predicted dithiol-disulfide oxidoreductase (DUF899 family)
MPDLISTLMARPQILPQEAEEKARKQAQKEAEERRQKEAAAKVRRKLCDEFVDHESQCDNI